MRRQTNQLENYKMPKSKSNPSVRAVLTLENNDLVKGIISLGIVLSKTSAVTENHRTQLKNALSSSASWSDLIPLFEIVIACDLLKSEDSLQEFCNEILENVSESVEDNTLPEAVLLQFAANLKAIMKVKKLIVALHMLLLRSENVCMAPAEGRDCIALYAIFKSAARMHLAVRRVQEAYE
jgi:hypothetical protein